MNPEISIILPCYNSAPNILPSLIIISEFIQGINRTFEIIVSDDGSNDGTQSMNWNEYHSQFNVEYIHNPYNKGKGEALRRGLYASRGKFIFFMDIDIPVELNALVKALDSMEKDGFNVVIGDRRIDGSKAMGTASIERVIASKIFNIGVQIIALPGYKDTQCPMKGFTADVINMILPFSFLTSFSFDVELIYLAKIHGYKINKIPVDWKDARSSMPLIKISCLVLQCLIDVAYMRLKHNKVKE